MEVTPELVAAVRGGDPGRGRAGRSYFAVDQ